jgi:hypothetical protein
LLAAIRDNVHVTMASACTGAVDAHTSITVGVHGAAYQDAGEDDKQALETAQLALECMVDYSDHYEADVGDALIAVMAVAPYCKEWCEALSAALEQHEFVKLFDGLGPPSDDGQEALSAVVGAALSRTLAAYDE